MESTVVITNEVSDFRGGAVSSPKQQLGIPGRWAYTPSFDIRDIRVERWFRHKSPGTQAHYALFMDRFLAWAQPRIHVNTPQQFFDWAERQPKIMLIQDVFEGFAETQKPSQRPYALSGLKTFLEKNGFERKLPKVEADNTPRVHHNGYQRKDILQLMGFLDNPLQKLFVYVAKDSGLRAGDVLAIEYHHLKPDLEAGLNYCHIHFEPRFYPPARKKKYAGITFIGPDSVKLMRKLVEAGEVSTKLDARIFPFCYTSILEVLRRAMKKAELARTLQPCHGLRKFFENALKKSDPPLDNDKKNQLEGHGLGIRWNYTDQIVDELRPLYERAYPQLDLSEEAAADRKMKALLDEVRELKEKASGYGDLQDQIDAMKQQQERWIRVLEEKLGSTPGFVKPQIPGSMSRNPI